MKFVAVILGLSLCSLLSGCVSRTVSEEPQHRGAVPGKENAYGSNSHSKVKEKKLIWIWQDEFRNPK